MWLKCLLCRKKLFFSLLPAIFFELPITRTVFDFPWRFELSGVECICSTETAPLTESVITYQSYCQSKRPLNTLSSYQQISMFLKLAGYTYWQLIWGFSNLWKNLSTSFLKNAKFVGMDQITCKNCNKSSWMQVNKTLLSHDRLEQFPSFFCRRFPMESNYYELKPRFKSLSFS